MSNILNKLKELVNYYNVNRGVGHTTRMLNGVYNDSNLSGDNKPYQSKPTYVLTHSSNFAAELNANILYYRGFRSNNVNAVSYTNGNYDKVLRGIRVPLLIDNCLLHQLFQEAANEIEYLKHDNELLTNHSKEVNIINEKLRTEIETLSTDANRYKQDNITLNHFNEKLETEKKELSQVITKLKCELLTAQEEINDSNARKEPINNTRGVSFIGQPKSFLSPLDMLIDNKEVKSIEVKIEYKE